MTLSLNVQKEQTHSIKTALILLTRKIFLRIVDAGVLIPSLPGHVANREWHRTRAHGCHPQDHRQPALVQQQVIDIWIRQ